HNIIRALDVFGWTVYAGGDFTGGPLALDATTGAASSWSPGADGGVDALAVSGSGSTVYVGGGFASIPEYGLVNSIGGEARNFIAALDATTGHATTWNPDANGVVDALAISPSTLYAGGDFTSIGGQARAHIAALDRTTGSATSWNPNALNDGVGALAVGPDGSLWVGGSFTSVGTAPQSG